MNSSNILFDFNKGLKDESHCLSIANFKPNLYDLSTQTIECKYSHHRYKPMYYAQKQYISLHLKIKHKDMFSQQFHTILSFHLHWLSKSWLLLKFQQQKYVPSDGWRLNEHRYQLLLLKAINIGSQRCLKELAWCWWSMKNWLRIPTPECNCHIQLLLPCSLMWQLKVLWMIETHLRALILSLQTLFW